MLNWYHYLRRLVTHAGSAAAPDSGRRRKTVRPKVEALEDRWVPAGLSSSGAPTNPAIQSTTIFQGEKFRENAFLFFDVDAPDVSRAIQSYGQPVPGVTDLHAVPATLFFVNEKGVRERVPVIVVQDEAVPNHVDVRVRRNVIIGNQAGSKIHFKILIPGVRDANHDGPLEILGDVKRRHQKNPKQCKVRRGVEASCRPHHHHGGNIGGLFGGGFGGSLGGGFGGGGFGGGGFGGGG
jgi:hypothetical protein